MINRSGAGLPGSSRGVVNVNLLTSSDKRHTNKRYTDRPLYGQRRLIRINREKRSSLSHNPYQAEPVYAGLPTTGEKMGRRGHDGLSIYPRE